MTNPNKPTQYDRADMQRLLKAGQHDKIDTLRAAGHFDDLLGLTRHYVPAAGQLTRADVEALSSEGRHGEILAAKEAGRLDQILGITEGTN